MSKFSQLFLKESKAAPITEMEFTPHGGVVKPIAVPADNSTAPGPTAVGHVEHPAPGLTEPKTVVTEVPASLAKPEGKGLNESVRKVGEHMDGTKKATVHKDSDIGEYHVKFHTDGKHHKDADYHTDDIVDANQTAKHWVGTKSK